VIEGRIGTSKRNGLDRIMAKLAERSKSVIGTPYLEMNAEKILSLLRLLFVSCCFVSVESAPAYFRVAVRSHRACLEYFQG
jgi:hypothetical protein